MKDIKFDGKLEDTLFYFNVRASAGSSLTWVPLTEIMKNRLDVNSATVVRGYLSYRNIEGLDAYLKLHGWKRRPEPQQTNKGVSTDCGECLAMTDEDCVCPPSPGPVEDKQKEGVLRFDTVIVGGHKEDIHVAIKGNTLSITYDGPRESFYRDLSLIKRQSITPMGVSFLKINTQEVELDVENIVCKYDVGILTVSIPWTEKDNTINIPVT